LRIRGQTVGQSATRNPHFTFKQVLLNGDGRSHSIGSAGEDRKAGASYSLEHMSAVGLNASAKKVQQARLGGRHRLRILFPEPRAVLYVRE
jgi:hypothetical protein